MGDEAEDPVEQKHGPDAELMDEIVSGGCYHQVYHPLGDDDRGDVRDEFCGIDDADGAEREVEDDDMQVDETDKDVVIDVSSK